jgi:hypothetical protein
MGPNAVIATHREGYNYLKFSLSDFLQSLRYRQGKKDFKQTKKKKKPVQLRASN